MHTVVHITASFLAVTDTPPLYRATTSHLPITGDCCGPRSFQRDDPAAKLILGSESPQGPQLLLGSEQILQEALTVFRLRTCVSKTKA